MLVLDTKAVLPILTFHHDLILQCTSHLTSPSLSVSPLPLSPYISPLHTLSPHHPCYSHMSPTWHAFSGDSSFSMKLISAGRYCFTRASHYKQYNRGLVKYDCECL